MKKQIIAIHGGDVYRSYDEYIAGLKRWKVDRSDFDGLSKKGWRGMLQKNLGDGFLVVRLQMPNPQNVRYLEWKIWFDKFVPFMAHEVVLVGHSMGGIFLAKYLAENRFPKKIRAVFLLAPPFQGNDPKDYMADFVLPNDLKRLKAYGDKIHIYQSKDDDLVLFNEFERYQKALPEAQTRIFKNRGHFKLPLALELVKDIKTLYR
jgi:predicted alpha/beta hydrolase family esterase